MGKSIKRWKKAQQAEIGHEAHDDGFTPRSHAEVYFSDQWDSDLEALADAKVLAVGSGTGIIHSLDFVDRNIALDPINHEIYENLSNSSAELVTGAGEALPFDSNSFDVVISFNVIDHTQRPTQVLKQIHDVLTTEGELYISSNTFETAKFIRKRLGFIDPPHPHHFSHESFRSRLSDAGFSIDYFDSSPRYSIKQIPQFFLNRSFRKMGAFLFRIQFTTAVASPKAK